MEFPEIFHYLSPVFAQPVDTIHDETIVEVYCARQVTNSNT